MYWLGNLKSFFDVLVGHKYTQDKDDVHVSNATLFFGITANDSTWYAELREEFNTVNAITPSKKSGAVDLFGRCKQKTS